MTIKYKGNKNRKFTEKETQVDFHYHTESVCISFRHMPAVTAREIGFDLVSSMVCQGFDVEHGDDGTDLWLKEVDYAILSGFGEGDGLPTLIEDLCGEYGYKADILSVE